jgi:hypothetical protein
MQPSNDGDLYQNSGDSYDTTFHADMPQERIEEEVKAAAVKAASYPILGDVADWFDEQIKACDSVDNINFDIQTIGGVSVDRKLSVEAQVLAYRMLKELLNEKYQEFKDFKHE